MSVVSKRKLLSAAAVALSLSLTTATAALVDATATAGTGIVTQSPTSNAFIVNASVADEVNVASASYDGGDFFGVTAGQDGISVLHYSESFLVPAGGVDVSYDYHFYGRYNYFVEAPPVPANLASFGYNLRVTSNGNTIASRSGLGNSAGFTGVAPFAISDVAGPFSRSLEVNVLDSLFLGNFATSTTILVNYEIFARSTFVGGGSSSASAYDPGGFSASPTGRFNVVSANGGTVPGPSIALLLLVGVFASARAVRARRLNT